MTLYERVLAIHRALDAADIRHAFGGAIALAYATRDPRGTSDIDVNIFTTVEEAPAVLAALPFDITDPTAARRLARDEQVRLWWEDTPVDLFFDYAPIHADAAREARMVPFADAEIPVLGPTQLAVFKAMFDRSRDWPDIEAMVAADQLDVDAVRAALTQMLAPDDERFARLDEAVRRATSP